MVEEGVLQNQVDVILDCINAQTEVGQIKYRPKGTMAASDWFTIKIMGKQTHGAYPWLGIDPIVTASQIVLGLQTIVSRNVNLRIRSLLVWTNKRWVRSNVIPEELTMTGTIRSLDGKVQDMLHARIKQVVTSIAESAGATADIDIIKQTLITYNDPILTEKCSQH
jgi:metal-dependent amidase/aminoacylase/carboxypeptidase family protein